MTGHREPWFLDRLRRELERAAKIEDRRERRGALGRLRLSPRLAAAVIAGAVVVAIVVIASAVSGTRDEERTARPAPQVVPTTTPQTDADAILRRLDGIYIAEITPAALKRMQSPYDPPAGWWRLIVRSAERTITVSAPEGPDSGDYTHRDHLSRTRPPELCANHHLSAARGADRRLQRGLLARPLDPDAPQCAGRLSTRLDAADLHDVA